MINYSRIDMDPEDREKLEKIEKYYAIDKKKKSVKNIPDWIFMFLMLALAFVIYWYFNMR